MWIRFADNAGAFIGAAMLLFATTQQATYVQDATLTAQYARIHLTGAQGMVGILSDEGVGSPDAVGFHGIFFRYAAAYARAAHDADVMGWLQFNAATAWAQRNALDLVWSQWWHSTPPYSEHPISSFEASSAVVAINCVAPRVPARA
jgi:hypothetical protein